MGGAKWPFWTFHRARGFFWAREADFCTRWPVLVHYKVLGGWHPQILISPIYQYTLFPNFGNAFFHSLPIPEFWEWIFSFPSRSRILGMEFSIPFPFPNFGNGIFYSRSRSRTLKSHSRSPLIRN